MVNRNNFVNVSIVFYDKFCDKKIKEDKLKIFLRLVNNLNNNVLIKKILIIDNSPYDLVKEKLFTFNKVEYIFCNKNIGFAKGHNLSKKFLSNQKYHLVLNPDIVITNNNLIKNCIKYLDHNKTTVMVQPLIIGYPDSEIQFLCKRNPTLFIQFTRGFFRKYINKIHFLNDYNNRYEMRNIAYSKSIIESTYLSGAFMFCKTEALDNINWFDERFFMYLEDADLTRRLSKIGKCVHNPYLKVRHVWAKGSRNNNFLKFIACISFFKYSLKWGLKIS